MSCPEWYCEDCGVLTFGFPEKINVMEMPCRECGKILTSYSYSDEDEARHEESKKGEYE